MFHCMPHWFTITGHDLNFFTWWFIVSSLMGMVCVVWSYALLFHAYWAGFVLFHLILHCIIIADHGLYCFTWCLTVRHHWSWFVLFHFMLHWFIPTGHCVYFPHFPHWFINTGHDFYCFTSLTGSSSLGMVCIVWLRASLVDPYYAWFVLSHFMLHWFFNRGHGLCCFTSCFIGSSFLGMVCIV